MVTRKYRWAVTGALLPVAGFAGGASADRYTLVNVADSTGAFSAVGGAPSINNAGVITFLGFKSDGSSGIYTGGNGGPISLVADTSGPIASFRQTPIINDNGLVAFRATRKAGGFGIYTAAPGGPLNLIAGESATLTTGGEPVLNDAGTVAFRATSNNVTGIYSGTGGALTAVVTAGSSGTFSTISPNIAINSTGVVAFATLTNTGRFAVYSHAPGQNGSTDVADSVINSLITFNNPAINNAGTVAFDAAQSSGNVRGVYRVAAGGSLSTVVDSTNGFQTVQLPERNNKGEVAFLGNPNVPEDPGLLFDGPNVLDGIVPFSLFGSNVNQISIAGRAINDSGQITFAYQLNNGRSGVIIATPTSAAPEPASAGPLALGAAGLLARRRVRA